MKADIYNNTVYLNRPTNGSVPKAVYIMSEGISGVSLRNNVPQTTVVLIILHTVATTNLRFEGNCYWTPGGTLLIDWNGTTYTTLDT